MGFQKKHVSGRSEDLDFFYRELPLKKIKISQNKQINFLFSKKAFFK